VNPAFAWFARRAVKGPAPQTPRRCGGSESRLRLVCVAPCTNVREFAGKFHEGIKKKDLHEVFPYLFDFKMAPRNVTVTLFYNKSNDTAWVFVREIGKTA